MCLLLWAFDMKDISSPIAMEKELAILSESVILEVK